MGARQNAVSGIYGVIASVRPLWPELWQLCAASAALQGTESCVLASDYPRPAVDAAALQGLHVSCPAEVGASWAQQSSSSMLYAFPSVCLS